MKSQLLLLDDSDICFILLKMKRFDTEMCLENVILEASGQASVPSLCRMAQDNELIYVLKLPLSQLKLLLHLFVLILGLSTFCIL